MIVFFRKKILTIYKALECKSYGDSCAKYVLLSVIGNRKNKKSDGVFNTFISHLAKQPFGG